MKAKVEHIVWGLVLVAAGAVLSLKALGVLDVNVFFKGWWTLFILIPSTIDLFTTRHKKASIYGLLLGTLLLLLAWDILTWSLLRKLVFPVLVLYVGIRLLIKGFWKDRVNDLIKKVKEQNLGMPQKHAFAAFSKRKPQYTEEPFYGAELTAVFGSVECDMVGALINQDCVITVNAIFGNVDVFLPADVNVKVQSVTAFGGLDDHKKRPAIESAPTVYIKATGLFGTINLK